MKSSSICDPFAPLMDLSLPSQARVEQMDHAWKNIFTEWETNFTLETTLPLRKDQLRSV